MSLSFYCKTFVWFLTALNWLQSTKAWDDSGALLIAQIAYDRLSPAQQQKLQAHLSGLSEGGHTYNTTGAACYTGDLRCAKHSYLALAEAPNANSVTLCSAYVAKTNQIACKQIVLAGYRRCFPLTSLHLTVIPSVERRSAEPTNKS